MALDNYKLAHDLVYPCRPLDPDEHLRRSWINALWPKNKILLSVTIELLRHYLASLIMSETEEIQLICAFLQDPNFKPGDCTEDAVRFHFKNFNFPALINIISRLSQYETNELNNPFYDAFKICINAIKTGQLLDKDVLDQPFNMSGLLTTLRRILDIARIHQFTEDYGHFPNLWKKLKEKPAGWEGYEEAHLFDDYVFEEVCKSALDDIYIKYGAQTREEKAYCERIFNDVGYHGIWEGAPAPFPWTKGSEPTLAMSRPRAKTV